MSGLDKSGLNNNVSEKMKLNEDYTIIQFPAFQVLGPFCLAHLDVMQTSKGT